MLANHCRTLLLLEKEYFKFNKNPLWGIEAEPLADHDFFHWEAIIKGPKDTIWEGGRFKVYLSFNESYSVEAPEVFFHTIPFHPNVEMKTGKPCIDFLDDANDWKEYYDVQFILLNLQTMLAFPVLENPVNEDAARLYRSRPKQYKQTVLDCVYASKRFDAGISPYLLNVESPNEKSVEQPIAISRSSQNSAAKVSFEDYHKIWANIATSKSYLIANHVDNEVDNDLDMQDDHYGFIESELEDELRKQMSEHNAVMYGKFSEKSSRAVRTISELKATKVQLLKQLYRRKQDLLDIPTPSLSRKLSDQIEPSEKEVDDLVNWTENLPDSFQ